MTASCVEMAFTVLSPPSRCVTSVTRPEAAYHPMPTLLWCYTSFSRGLHLSSLCSKRYPQGLCPLQNWAVSEPLPLLACCNSVVKFPTFARCVGINTLVFHSILILFKLISDIQRWKETRNTCWWLEYLLFWSNRWTGEYFKVKIWLKVVLLYAVVDIRLLRQWGHSWMFSSIKLSASQALHPGPHQCPLALGSNSSKGTHFCCVMLLSETLQICTEFCPADCTALKLLHRFSHLHILRWYIMKTLELSLSPSQSSG